MGKQKCGCKKQVEYSDEFIEYLLWLAEQPTEGSFTSEEFEDWIDKQEQCNMMKFDIEPISVQAKSRYLRAEYTIELPKPLRTKVHQWCYVQWLRLKWIWRRNVRSLK